ncbi:MAG TPA: putative oxidoreductase C-terminal domain-containing protein [Bacteroidales bacterium]|nr:putative oxidoreductase C-terminal domain-containing protein [Bacteroidales bacterium]
MIRLITLDPGHFHAALVQKSMYPQVSADVHVYAPEGDDLKEHLSRIGSYNSRPSEPTHWNEIVYSGKDFFGKMLSGKKGNVVVLAGNNEKKATYIRQSVDAGFNVISDKPMIIRASDFPALEKCFGTAREKHTVLLDIMTERYEIATILQRSLSLDTMLFGNLTNGSENDPAVSKISVHHFSKIISGVPVRRPAWYFDTGQQGEGIVDVTTHLVDLIQWECFPEKILGRKDVSIASARRWSTNLTAEEFRSVTGLGKYPGFLSGQVENDTLKVFSNGEFTYCLNGIWARVSVEWHFKAPGDGGDTHFSIMKGSKCSLTIKQGAEENFIPTLYLEVRDGENSGRTGNILDKALSRLPYEGLSAEKISGTEFRINIPARYRVGHEEHFAQVMAKFLGYMEDGRIPEWEEAAMITKYYTTTSALDLAMKSNQLTGFVKKDPR